MRTGPAPAGAAAAVAAVAVAVAATTVLRPGPGVGACTPALLSPDGTVCTSACAVRDGSAYGQRRGGCWTDASGTRPSPLTPGVHALRHSVAAAFLMSAAKVETSVYTPG